MKKYNPKVHGNLVDNHRRTMAKVGIVSDKYTDEQLFNVIEYWSGMSTHTEEELAIWDDVTNGVKR